jgi:hypothetical protein
MLPTEIAAENLIADVQKKIKRRRENFDPEVFGLRIVEETTEFTANFRAALGRAWGHILESDIEESTAAQIIASLPSLLPAVDNPLIFSNFLLRKFKQGGELAVASLSSLFLLITKHKLECKGYYKYLYRTLAIEFGKSEPSKEYLKLVEASLKSSALPAKIVAAFMK